jgi:hypothetical protein
MLERAVINAGPRVALSLIDQIDLQSRGRKKISTDKKLGLMQDLLTGYVPVKVGAGEMAIAHKALT